MKKTVLLATFALLLTACSPQEENENFENADSNNDGCVTRTEYYEADASGRPMYQNYSDILRRYDSNRDGVVCQSDK
jgi:hypothetical protein